MNTVSKETRIGDSFTKETYVIESLSTSDATPLWAYGISVPTNKAVYIMVRYVTNSSNYSSASGGKSEAVFFRAAGNLSRTDSSSSKGLWATILGNFSGNQPSLDLIANTTTQEIDIFVTGKPATVISWHLEVMFYMSN